MHISKAQPASSVAVPDHSPEQRPGQPAPTGAPQLQSASTGAPPAFFDAARSGDVGAMATMLATRQAVGSAVEPKSGMTALMLAAMRGHVDAVSLLINWRDAGSFINARDAHGISALFLARAAGHDGIAALLEEAGAKVAPVLSAGVTLVAGEAGKVPMPVGAANAGMAQPVSIAGVVVGSGETTASAMATTTQASSTMVTGAMASTQVALSGGAARPKPASLLQAAEEGDAAALRAMLEEMHAAGKDVKREVNRYGASGKFLWQDDSRGYPRIRLCDEPDDSDYSSSYHGWDALLSTPLNLAAALGHDECVDILLEAGAEIDMRDEFGPPICWAARGGHAVIVSKLVAINSASLAEMNRFGQTPLGLAAMRGHAETVRMLLEAGAKVDMPSGHHTEYNNCSNWTPLMHAARAGHVGVVQILIDAKANVHAKLENRSGQSDYREGMNALNIAAEFGRADVVRLLIKAGCNVNETLKDEMNGPLYLASWRSLDANTVKVLLEAGARKSYLDKKPGPDTLLTGAVTCAPASVIQALLQDGERADWNDSRGYSSLTRMASYSQRAENVAILVRHGADIESTDDRGNTPLMNAAGRGAGPMVQALLDAGAKVNESNRQMYQSGSSHYKNYYYGFTPLMCAVSDGHTAIARTLLRAGANVNALGGDGSTALILAVRGKHLDSVRLLLEAGADCKPKCFDETAYSIASKNGSHEIAVLLQKYM